MRSIWGIISVIIFMMHHFMVQCQEVPGIINFDPKDYHGLGQNWDSTIGCDGSIYIANTDGVLIYNGVNWNKLRLPNDVIPRSIHTGKDCKIYVGGYETFGFVDETYRSDLKFVSLSDSILFDSQQEIWTMSEHQGQIIFQSFAEVYLYDYEELKRFHPPSNIILGNIVGSDYLVPSIENRIFSFENGMFSVVEGSLELPIDVRISAICPFEDNKILVGTLDHGLFTIEGSICKPLNTKVNNEFKEVQINRMLKLQSGHYAVGTILNGLYIVNDSLEEVHHLNKSNGLSNNTVLSLLELENGDLMLGLDKGADIIQLSSNDRYYYDKQGKLGTVYASIRFNDRLYLGTNQGVFVNNSKNGFSLLPNTQGQVWDFFILDNVLLCGHNSGLLRIDTDGVKMVFEETGTTYIDTVNDSILLLSTYTGLAKMIYKDGSFSSPESYENLILKRFILENQLLVGVSLTEGLRVIEFSNDYSQIISSQEYDQIDSVKVGSDLVLINYEDSLYIYHNNKYYQCQIGQIIEIKNKELTEVLDNISYKQLVFDDRNVIPLYHHTVFNTIVGGNEKSDQVLVGIDDGYKIISLNKEQEANIDSIRINIDYVKTTNRDITSNIGDLLILPHNINDLQIQLSSEIKPFKINNYRFRLIGWDDDWLRIPEDGNLVFRNLDHGDYKFVITNSHGSNKELLSFTIKPPWYESYIGYILYCILIGILAYLIYRRIQQNLEVKLKNLAREKQIELDKERIKSRNEKLEKELVYKSKMLANSTMTLIQKNKVLNELKEYLSTMKSLEADGKRIKQKIMHQIERNINSEEEWQIFEKNFAEVHDDFLSVIKTQFPDITASELRLAAYIKMNLSSKEIAPLLNISIRSVENKRYRLRKKMDVPHDISIANFLMRY